MDKNARRAIGFKGHLDKMDKETIICLWNESSKIHGAVRQISQKTGFSEPTISNVILKYTGMRPSFHKGIK